MENQVNFMKNQINFFTINDIMAEIDGKQPIDPRKTYDPLSFWDGFADMYYRSFKKPQEIQKHIPWIIRTLDMLKPKNILDVGCGFCRIEPFLLDAKVVEEITAVDFSQKMLDSAEDYLSMGKFPPEMSEEDKAKARAKVEERRKKITLKKASAKNLPYPEGSFDVVFACELFSHMPPKKIRIALRSLLDVAKKYVILIERFLYPGEHPQPHIWTHDYHKALFDWGIQPIENKAIANGTVALIVEK